MEYWVAVTPVTALQVLGEPNRQAILGVLRDGEQPVGELVDRLRLSQPAAFRAAAPGGSSSMRTSRVALSAL